MPKKGTLSEAERRSIKIEEFIFHIILKNHDDPVYLGRVVLERDQEDFFCERIGDSAEGTQYCFRDKEMGTALRCRRILDNPEGNFLTESRGLSLDFKEQHRGNVNDGAFIIALFTVDSEGVRIPMIALLKMDHQKVLEYIIKNVNGEQVATMHQILNSFVEDRSAVQKSAIIEVGDYFEWDVLAQERKNPRSIAEYFKVFLSVNELNNPSNLTRNAVATVGRWARDNKNRLPEEHRRYRMRAISYMESHDAFGTDDFLNMVVRDDDGDRKADLVASLRDALSESGVAGQRFSPCPESIPRKEKRTKLITREGVQITWEGPEEAANVNIHEPSDDGMITIEIRTQNVSEP